MKFLRAFLLLGAVSCTFLYLTPDADVPKDEIGPCALLTWGILYLAMRAPFRPFRLLELPLAACFLASTALGALWFKDEGGFSVFMCVYAALAWSYGFFCTCLEADHHWRQSVVEPTRAAFHLGLPDLDIGLVLAPFVWPYYWWKATRPQGPGSFDGNSME